MRIGIDCRMYRQNTAGIGRYTRNLIKNLLKIDKNNQYVLFMTAKDLAEFNLQSPNIKVVKCDIPHYSFAEQTGLIKFLKKENLDLIHFTNFNHPIRYRGKFVVTIHDLTLLFFPDTTQKTSFFKKIAFSKVMKAAIQNSIKIIAPSLSTKKDILKFSPTDPDKIEVIYEAADEEEKLKAQSSKLEIKEKFKISKPIILYVGQYKKHKNIDNLLKAYKILKKELHCQLALIGKISENLKAIIDNDPDLRDTLRPGFVSDEELAAWYEIAAVFSFPSLYEGFGLPGLEAMVAGLPVVASNQSSLPEVYGEAALYFDPLNPHDIADKIKIVLENSETKDRLIKAGKIQVKKFSWQKMAEETLNIYKEVTLH